MPLSLTLPPSLSKNQSIKKNKQRKLMQSANSLQHSEVIFFPSLPSFLPPSFCSLFLSLFFPSLSFHATWKTE